MKDELEAKVVYVRDAPTKGEARRYQIAPGDDIRFAGRPAPFHRKQIVITNKSSQNLQIRVGQLATHAEPAQALLTGSDSGPLGGTVFPTSIIGIFTSDSIWLKNANAAGTLEVDVLELWYV